MAQTPVRVLIVDDDPAIRCVLALAMDHEGYSVEQACNGREGLELLARWQPDLVLLDLMMPEVDGWTFRARQLATDGLSAIPVIVLSAGHNLHARVDALQATAILPKPFDLAVLLATVDAVATRNHGTKAARV